MISGSICGVDMVTPTRTYKLRVELRATGAIELEFKCPISHETYTYKETADGIEKYTDSMEAGMNSTEFYEFIIAAIKNNSFELSQPNLHMFELTLLLKVKITQKQILIRNFLLTLRRTNNNQNLSLILAETMEDLFNVMLPDPTLMSNLYSIYNRLDNLRLVSGVVNDKITNIKSKITNLLEVTKSSCPTTCTSNIPLMRNYKRMIYGLFGHPIHLDKIDFGSGGGINGSVIDSFMYSREKVRCLVARPTIKNVTSNVITLSIQHHLVKLKESMVPIGGGEQQYSGHKSTVLTSVSQILPNGILTLHSQYMLQDKDHKFFDDCYQHGIVFTLDGDINSIEFVNMKQSETYCC